MDVAHKETDKILEDIEKRLRKEYRQATKEVEQKLDNYFAAFRRKDEKKRALLDAGEITQKEYNDWRYGQMCVGKRWEDMRDKLAADLSKTDVIARNIADGYMPEVYAVNHNFATYQIETGARLDTSYTLYDAQSVERLVRDNPDVLPQIGRTTQELIDKGVLKKWNMKNIQSTAIQGILQGESITKMAKRMANDVGASNYKDCVRHARTMTTATQNAGRVDGFKRANDMGIDVVQEWVATIDGRTRHEHRILDGQRRKVGEPFEVEGEKIMYPADPTAPYHLIMNCRCTLIGQIKGFERNTQAYREDKDLDGMTYDEWKQAKAPKKAKITQATPAQTQTKSAQPKTTANAIHTNNMDSYNWLQNAATSDKIEHNAVKTMQTPLKSEQIIEKLAGGDQTNGSCASLSLCYAANRCGIDVTDYRGGLSQRLFSRSSNLDKVFETANAKAVTHTIKKEAGDTAKILQGIEKDKEYILVAGKHAAIVRKTDDGLQYLEMQSARENGNGWKPFETNGRTVAQTLNRRFGCTKSQKTSYGFKLTSKATLVDVESFQPTEELKGILGYINTDASKQMKGASGGIK